MRRGSSTLRNVGVGSLLMAVVYATGSLSLDTLVNIFTLYSMFTCLALLDCGNILLKRQEGIYGLAPPEGYEWSESYSHR
jgi:hypothetical protein